MANIEHLLQIWHRDPLVGKNIAHWVSEASRPGIFSAIPDDLHPGLRHFLNQQGIFELYSHQVEALEAVRSGSNLALATGTASGKTLAYNLPVIDSLLRDNSARAMYLFPTKALTQDQHAGLQALCRAARPENPIPTAVYDGDSPAHVRAAIRKQARILLTNPDMLHMGILPHHTQWAAFFQGLQFVVLDEMHTYRGVFGSHVANVLRRLRRTANFYGASPRFILTSATIGNPAELAERLVEDRVVTVDRDGSPRGLRHFLIYNPPVVDPDLGIRRSAVAESVRLTSDLITYDVQTLAFARTRRTTELALKYLLEKHPDQRSRLHGYRSGYLPSERRGIEQDLRSGAAKAVVATTALELGIDIGGVEAAVLIGYPGTIAATRQQGGRAGRKQQSAAAVMVASAAPLDQFLVQHPEYILQNSPEKALINPDNDLILLQHLRCAAFELPFRQGERFGSLDWDRLKEYLDFLAAEGQLQQSADRYYWIADHYPAEGVSLRTASAQTVLLQVDTGYRQVTIGQVDRPSATWMVHPHAVYLHEAQSYLVEELDLDGNVARLQPVELDYYTDPISEIQIVRRSVDKQEPVHGGMKGLGELQVTSRVTGFKQLRWGTNEVLGVEGLDLPPSHLITEGYWLAVSAETINALTERNLWNSAANDYGPEWNALRLIVRQRDQFTCQACGAVERERAHHVHHKTPFRAFPTRELANRPDNLVTLCPTCHRQAESAVRVRTGLSGLQYVLNQLAPLFVMCDVDDLGSACDPESPVGDGQPTVILYDQIPAGIGLTRNLYEIHDLLLASAHDLVSACACADGCPSCVGAGGSQGQGGKIETLALLAALTGKELQ